MRRLSNTLQDSGIPFVYGGEDVNEGCECMVPTRLWSSEDSRNLQQQTHVELLVRRSAVGWVRIFQLSAIT